VSHRVPKAFDGFRILHLSDLHTDMSQQAMTRLLDLLPSLEYELCVLTGDYRGKSFGPFNQCLAGMAQLREALNEPIYGVLGDHDTIRMVPDLEAMGIRMLLNECVVIERVIWRGSTTPTFTERTILRKRRMRFRTKTFRSFCPTRLKYTGRPRVLDSICC